ncbi:MAG TPA: tetratricopeptide repeat protein [Chloroflexia bacterium]|nr:tetratricopeptide repeat protein [Chloroflexia bacterium]
MSHNLDFQAELKAAQAELLKNPGSVDNWNRAAIALIELGDLNKAADYIGHAIALEPGEALHYSNRGRVLFALERPNEALEDYTRAIELAPGADLYSSRSVIYMVLGRDAAALSDLNDAYDLDPSVTNLLNRAAFFSNKGMAADALRDVSKVIELEPENPNHRLTRANLAFALASHYPELYEMGINDVEEAIKLDKEGVLSQSLIQLADQLESYIGSSPNPEVSRRLINLIRGNQAQ